MDRTKYVNINHLHRRGDHTMPLEGMVAMDLNHFSLVFLNHLQFLLAHICQLDHNRSERLLFASKGRMRHIDILCHLSECKF